MFTYIAYGLGIHSPMPLPELVEGEAPEDILIRQGEVAWSIWEEAPEGYHRYHAKAEEIYLQYDGVGTFLARRGREIIVDPVSGIEDRELRAYILGPALGVLLHQRGLLTLHASAVSINGGAVAFLGGSTWGKSTTAAALRQRGHGLVSDDVLAIEINCQHGPQVYPAFPRLKLWPDAASALLDAPERLVRLSSRREKLDVAAIEGFSGAPLPLRRVYVLGAGLTQEIQPLSAQEACMELVRHSFCIRLIRFTGRASHFKQCVDLANQVPVLRLRLQRSLAALPELAKLLEEDIADT